MDQPSKTLLQQDLLDDTRCDADVVRPYCNFWESFLSLYTMLLGNVQEDDFKNSVIATVFFVLYMFLVVILLANVLIAIVTDSYKVIQDQRAAIVFWTNRLDFVAEMDAIANGPWKGKLKKAFGIVGIDSSSNKSEKVGKDLWARCTELFDDEVEAGVFSVDFVLYTITRIIVAVFVIPLWLLLGVVSLGWLWPPQVRESVFTSAVFKHSSDSMKEDEMRRTQIKLLQEEVVALKDELLQELALDRTQIVQMKSHAAERKIDIAHEMKDIKKIVAILFERRTI